MTWKHFGFPERGGSDSTIWIGNDGAHTPCHLDTYGCNLVAQVYGRYVSANHVGLYLFFVNVSEHCD